MLLPPPPQLIPYQPPPAAVPTAVLAAQVAATVDPEPEECPHEEEVYEMAEMDKYAEKYPLHVDEEMDPEALAEINLLVGEVRLLEAEADKQATAYSEKNAEVAKLKLALDAAKGELSSFARAHKSAKGKVAALVVKLTDAGYRGV